MVNIMKEQQVRVNVRTPWDSDVEAFLAAVRERVNFDSMMVGVFNAKRPNLDEVMVCHNMPEDTVRQWIETGFSDDEVLKDCMRVGSVSAESSRTGWLDRTGALPKWLSYNLISSCAVQPGCWFAITGRSASPFTDQDTHSLTLMLRTWESRFNRPKEPDMCRLMVGHDDRLIYTDPQGEQTLLDCRITVGQIMDELRATMAQRWPDFEDRVLHDVALELSGKPWWIRFRRQRAVNDKMAVYWYIEMRPLESDDLATVGVVPDERIARAVGYIHDNYNKSPNLNTVAGCVQISPFHFHRLFSKQVGVTPKQYVLQKQIQMAKWMLRSSNAPISNIAKETGFASHGHFTSTFRRFVGISPTEYRQNNSPF
ncbi:MAG: AraC family transcriptional regulator [Planctomycetes bacterium]|nr:AraC family transcriptional regulator [Planctomycetota bacterium]